MQFELTSKLGPPCAALFWGVNLLLLGIPDAEAVEESLCTGTVKDNRLDYGQIVTCEIQPTGDADDFLVWANSGDTLIVRVVRHSGPGAAGRGVVCLRVLDQGTGDEILPLTCNSTVEQDIPIPNSSNYLLRISRQSGNTGVYSLSASCAGASCGPSIGADLPDADGDGNGDIVIRRGNLFLADTAKDGGAPELAVRYGAPTDIAFFADMDGDNMDELVIRRGNAYLIDLANDGGQPELIIRYGTANDHMLAFDIDNDGRDDLVIRRGNLLLGDTSHDGRFPETVIRVFSPRDTYLSRSGR